MRYLIIIFLGLTLISCQNEIGFDSEKWNEKGVDWQLSDNREKMVSDLIKSDTLKGMEADQIILLLGEPEFKKEKSLEFLIREKHSFNIDPDYIKYLIVETDENGKATNYYVKTLK
jgi:hypothetical protein